MVVGHEHVDAASTHLAFEVNVSGNGCGWHSENVHQKVNPKFLCVLLLVVLAGRNFANDGFPSLNELSHRFFICHVDPTTLYNLYIHSI